MKPIIIILCCLLFSCTNIKQSDIFNEALFDRWEKVTLDTINHIYKHNLRVNKDTFQLNLLQSHCKRFYNHQARQQFVDNFKRDTNYANADDEDFIVIEQSNDESMMFFRIIYSSNNKNICLSYKLVQTKPTDWHKSFVFYKKDSIDNNKLKKFIDEVTKSDLLKNESNNGEYFHSDMIVSFFSKDKVEVFPYLTYNFANEIYKSYNDMFNNQ